MRIHPLLVRGIEECLATIFSAASPADKVLERTFKAHSKWGSRDRRFVAENVYDIVRWKRRLEATTQALGYSAQSVPALVRVFSTWKGWGTELDVEEVQKAWEKVVSQGLGVEHSFPDWLVDLGRQELGENWPAELSALNERPPVDLRVNSLKTDRETLIRHLHNEGIEVDAVPEVPSALSLRERKNVFTTNAFKLGHFEVQDRSSQRVAPFLDPQPGERVIDACAGAGGKTLHLAALMQNKGRLIAMDITAWKLKELSERARRAGVQNYETREIENNKVIKRLEGSADRLLLDVPCTGLGVVRRNPDTKWKLTPAGLEEVRKLQRDLLTRYSKMLKAGGRMVYSTCSILPSENQDQVNWFLKQHPSEFELEDSWSVLPSHYQGDGFFAARLRRIL